METQQVGPACQEDFGGRGVATICEQFSSMCECVRVLVVRYPAIKSQIAGGL